MTDKEALKLALDELMEEYDMVSSSFAKRVDEIFKQALAAQQEHEPENEPYVSLASVQEPVAWVTVEDGKCISTRSADFRHIADGQYHLYVGPLAYEVPAAQRQWVGLTDEQISAIGSKIFPSTWNTRHVEFARAIEAKLKELNT
jgi:hypothetical protein